uniref:Uncharacterized protein n=1 Tax=Cacopsylla melanoneura TaxID=428564 RepID=A0A8D8TZU3_9HEMI
MYNIFSPFSFSHPLSPSYPLPLVLLLSPFPFHSHLLSTLFSLPPSVVSLSLSCPSICFLSFLLSLRLLSPSLYYLSSSFIFLSFCLAFISVGLTVHCSTFFSFNYKMLLLT